MTIDEYRENLDAMDNEELFGEAEWLTIVNREIDYELDAYRVILEEKDDEDLFGEERLAEMRAAQIDALVEGFEGSE